MHARVTSIQGHINRIDDSIRLFRDSILPEARKQQGFNGALLLTDRATGNGLALTLWESEADARTSETDGYYAAQLAKIAPLLTIPPTRETLEVVLLEAPMTRGATLAARVVTGLYPANKVDEAIRLVRESVIPAAKQQHGFAGTLQLADRAAGKGISVTLWDTMVDLTQSETSGYFAANLAKVTPLMLATPTRMAYEVPVAEDITLQGLGVQPEQRPTTHP